MPGEVIGLKHGARWTKVTERAVRCDWFDQAARGSVALWVRANRLAFVYRHLMAFASAATLLVYLVFWPVDPTFVI